LEQAAREHPEDEGETTGGSPADRDPVTSVPGAPPRAARPSSVTSPIPGSVVPSAPPRQRAIQDLSAAPIIAPAAKAADETHVKRPNPTVEQAPLPPPLDLRPPPPPHGPRG
jgi:hypothetical protein